MAPLKLAGLGDNVVDRYVDQGVLYPGGNAVNVAVHARRSGADTAFVGVLGTDAAGDLVELSLLSEGVRLERVRRAQGDTAFATVYTDESGDRSFGLCHKGVSLFLPNQRDLDYLAEFDIVHLCETIRLEAKLPAIASCAAVSYDFSGRDNVYAAPLLRWVTFAIFSRPESSREEAVAQIAWAHSCGARWVVVTRGARGAAISDGMGVHLQEAAPAQVVDTLGAGDSFIARLLVRLWEGAGLAEAASEAASYSAEVCGCSGGFGHGRSLAAATSSQDVAKLTNEG